MRKLDFSTFTGISIALAIVAATIIMSSSIEKYLNFPSFLLVVGSTIAVSCASYSFKDVWNAFKTMAYLIAISPVSCKEIATKTLESSEIIYKNGLSDIFKKERILQHKTFKKWLGYVVDGEKTQTIDVLITQEIDSYQDQQSTVIQLITKAAELAPAYGLIGTILGLVQMLSAIQDINMIGEGLSVALLTTFYGAILSYVLLFPMASKLERNLQEDLLNFKLMHKTILSISERENPRQLEPVINSILPPGKRIIYFKY